MVNPYVSWSATEQLNLWATFLELDMKGVRRSNTDGNPEHRLLLQVRSDL